MTLPQLDRDDLILALTAGDELEDCEHYLDAQTGHVLYAGEGVEDLPADLRGNPRYIRVEPLPPSQLLQVMTDFVDALADPAIAAWLRKALLSESPGPAFKAALLRFPSERDAWLVHQHQAFEALADAWCRDHGLGDRRQASLH